MLEASREILQHFTISDLGDESIEGLVKEYKGFANNLVK
jgi:hypothetical protein